MKHTDLTDVANETADLLLGQALLNHTNAVAKKKRPFSEECVECGTIIPEQRQQATGGTDICVCCMETLERMRK